MSGLRLGLVGRGRAARTLAPHLDAAGHAIAWWWSRGDSQDPAALARVDVVVLAVPDGAIASAARAFAARPAASQETFLHLSGSVPGAAARATPTAPRAAGALHVLQALPGTSVPPEHLCGVTAGLDGEPEAVAVAERLARGLGLRPVHLAPGTKAAYHAAAALVAGHATALFAQAQDLLLTAGFSEDASRAALQRLMAGAVANLVSTPPADAVTGPIARGDVTTVEAHLAAIEAAHPGERETAKAYRLLGRRALALSRGTLCPDAVTRLEEALAEP